VATNLENLEKLGNLKTAREKSGKIGKVRGKCVLACGVLPQVVQ